MAPLHLQPPTYVAPQHFNFVSGTETLPPSLNGGCIGCMKEERYGGKLKKRSFKRVGGKIKRKNLKKMISKLQAAGLMDVLGDIFG